MMFELQKHRGVIFHDTEEWRKIWRKTGLWCGKWHQEFGKFSPEHSKVSTLGLWWDPFVQCRKSMTLKFTEDLCAMKIENNAKLGEKLTYHFKTDMRNLTNFDLITWKAKKFALQLVPKYIMFHSRKVQKSYAWWHWRLMDNLKKNWLVLSKMTWGI